VIWRIETHRTNRNTLRQSKTQRALVAFGENPQIGPRHECADVAGLNADQTPPIEVGQQVQLDAAF
jgi:hypothetical protein